MPVLPRNIGMPYKLFYKLLFRTGNYAKHRITRREKQQPTALRVDATDLAGKPVAYRLARRTAIWVGWPLATRGRAEAQRVPCGATERAARKRLDSTLTCLMMFARSKSAF